MVQINFNPDKPGYRSRLTSKEINENFRALSRANDLRVTEQDPPDLTVHVEAGSYATSSEKTIHYEGGNSSVLDTTAGGSSGQKRVFVLEIDASGILHWNKDSSWATPPVEPLIPTYSSNRIPLCEVTITYGDTEIVEGQIRDVRPMINLGVGLEQALSPGSVILTASNGQKDFNTSAHFTFSSPNEILVWSTNPGVSPDPSNGLFFRVYDVDYTILNDTTIRFGGYSFAGGEIVVIWKVGLAATPGSIGLADLSNVDGDQEAAFLGAHIPTASNPFLTESGHNAIDHLTDVSSLSDVSDHISTTATSPHKHMASEIEIEDPGDFSNATNVQKALEDVDGIIYTPFMKEHKASGEHGPNVTINTTSGINSSLTIDQDINAEGLLINKSDTGDASVVVVNNTGTGNGIKVVQVGDASGGVIQKTATDNSPALLIENSGVSGAGLKIVQPGESSGEVIIKTATGSSPALLIENSGTGVGVHIRQSTSPVSTAALYVEQKHSTGRAVRIDQGGNSVALYLNKTAAGDGNIIEINNVGTGYDMLGHNSNWSIDSFGNALFNTVSLTNKRVSIFTFSWNNTSEAQSTGSLGFEPRVAFALHKSLASTSVGFATGVGSNAKTIAWRESYGVGTTDYGNGYGEDAIAGRSREGITQNLTLLSKVSVTSWGSGGIELEPSVNMTSQLFLLVMG